jgi:peptide/nickel transport system permease protein
MGRLLARYASLAVAVVVLNFLLPRLLPGDPLDVATQDGFGPATPTLTADTRGQLRATYHLDEPLVAQFVAYPEDLSRDDLGWSIRRATPVSQLIADRLLWTLGLVLSSVLVASLGDALLGVLAAWRGGRADRLEVISASFLAALPEFLVAMALLLVFAVGVRWFPLQGGHSTFAATGASDLAAWADVVWHLTLPALTLVLATSAGFVLLASGALLAVRDEPYVVAARA